SATTVIYTLSLHDALPISVSFADGEKKILWLDYVAVLPEFRRRGIGSSLLSKVENWATQHSCNMLYTGLNPNNTPSQVLLGRKRSEEHTSELQSRGHLVCR